MQEQKAVLETPMDQTMRRQWQELNQEDCSRGVVFESDTDPAEAMVPVSKVALIGVQFRSERVLHPGTVRQMRVGERSPRLMSQVRIISCRPRVDGSYDVKGEFF
jgi:hypothetical protein